MASPVITAIRSCSPAAATRLRARPVTAGRSRMAASMWGWRRAMAIDHDPVPPPTSSSRWREPKSNTSGTRIGTSPRRDAAAVVGAKSGAEPRTATTNVGAITRPRASKKRSRNGGQEGSDRSASSQRSSNQESVTSQRSPQSSAFHKPELKIRTRRSSSVSSSSIEDRPAWPKECPIADRSWTSRGTSATLALPARRLMAT